MKIAVCGRAGVGKDLVARMLAEELYKIKGIPHRVGNFALPIKRFLQILLNLSDDHLYGYLKEVPNTFSITPDSLDDAAMYYRLHIDDIVCWDKFWDRFQVVMGDRLDQTGNTLQIHSTSPRELFQFTGTEVGRFLNQDMWTYVLLNAADTIDIVSDLRFISEQEILSKNGYIIVRINGMFGALDDGSTAAHISEQEFSKLAVDIDLDNRFAIHNDKTATILRGRVINLIQYIETNLL